MNTKIILVLVIILSLAIIVIYLNYYKKPIESPPYIKPIESPPYKKPIESPIESKDAKCSIPKGTTQEGIQESNKDENYNFEIMKLGREIKNTISQYIRTFKKNISKEEFSFSSQKIYDINQLDNDTIYYVGNLKPESQVKTISPPLNGGRLCLSFPQIIYLTSTPNYTKYSNKDIGGYDIICYDDGRSAERCQNECSNNSNCKGTNYIYPNTHWGSTSGCCLKTVSGPLRDINGIDFYVKNSNVSQVQTIQIIRIKRINTSPDGSNAINIADIQAFDINGKLINPQASSYSDGGIGFPASNSIDGNMNNFSHTSDARDNFIQVSYSSPVQVSKIVITNRKDCCKNRMIGTHLQLFSKSGETPDIGSIPITDTRDIYTFTFNGSSWNLN
jgi:hypothetical protein